MPVNVLLVEGDLDAQLLGAVYRGLLTIEIGGPKNSLAPQVIRRRQKNDGVCYIRDRDFDFEPPNCTHQPSEDRSRNGQPLGWRWCRHAIENYLLEPALVAEVTGWEISRFSDALCAAARRIRHYEVSRWVIGQARRGLPPHHDLKTQPDGLKEIAVPDDLSETASLAWARRQITDFKQQIDVKLGDESVGASIEKYRALLTDEFLSKSDQVLLWCSGKDLFASLADWLRSEGRNTPGDFRAELRDWVRKNSEQALELLPEWRGFKEMLDAF